MSVIGVIQARMGSSRLPGKVLIDLAGHCMLERVVLQLRAVDLIDEVVVATSDQLADDQIASWCAEHDVATFRGDEVDVLDRYYRAGLAFEADHVVRATADCPFLDQIGAREVVARHLEGGAAYTHNISFLNSGMPLGTGVEAFTFDALKRSWHEGHAAHHREHVDEYIIEHPGLFPTVMTRVRPSVQAPDLRLTVDVDEDVQAIRAILAALVDPAPPVSLDEIVRLARERPDLVAINRTVVQKTI